MLSGIVDVVRESGLKGKVLLMKRDLDGVIHGEINMRLKQHGTGIRFSGIV
jgi:hypothetical protein